MKVVARWKRKDREHEEVLRYTFGYVLDYVDLFNLLFEKAREAFDFGNHDVYSVDFYRVDDDFNEHKILTIDNEYLEAV